MKDKDIVVLDFNNDKLKFSLSKVSTYNIGIIYNNIDKFNKFVNDSVISHTFEQVYKSSVFQVALFDENSAYVDNLVAIYNAIASGNLLDNVQVPQITEKELIKQLRIRGYKVYRSRISLGNGIYDNVKKVKLDHDVTW